MTVNWRVLVGVGLTGAAALCFPGAGIGKIVEYPRNPSATAVGKAIAVDPSLVRRAYFATVPPSSKPVAVSTTPLAKFPRSGPSYAILSTGNARLAATPNNAPDSGVEAGGPAIRGARDVTIMRVFLRVPKGANCLSFRFRFLSEEYPEFVGDSYNDAFIAELDHSTWTAATKDDPTIKAPNNFATDSDGNPIRINTVGSTNMTAGRAKGTTYDGATRILRASTRITPGSHSLYLSIFDQGDRIYDSAVFIDKLIAGKRSACKTGVAVDS